MATFSKLDQIKDHKNYVALLKKALLQVKPEAEKKFLYFEKFPFGDKERQLVVVDFDTGFPALLQQADHTVTATGIVKLTEKDELNFEAQKGKLKRIRIKKSFATMGTGIKEVFVTAEELAAEEKQKSKDGGKQPISTTTATSTATTSSTADEEVTSEEEESEEQTSKTKEKGLEEEKNIDVRSIKTGGRAGMQQKLAYEAKKFELVAVTKSLLELKPAYEELVPTAWNKTDLETHWNAASKSVKVGEPEAAKEALGKLRIAMTQPPPRPTQAIQTPQQIKADLQQQLVALNADLITKNTSLANLTNEARSGGDLKIIQQQIKQLLSKNAWTVGDAKEAKGLFTELKIKVDFIATRNKEVEKQRGKLDEYATLLDSEKAKFPKVDAETLSGDKSLKAGDAFKGFCEALKAYESATADKNSTADLVSKKAEGLRSNIRNCLEKFDKISKAAQEKPAEQKKREAVLKAKAALEHEDMLRTSAALKAKPDWSREDEAKAAELYLQMMLELAELDQTPRPKNLKEGSGGELVMQIKNEKAKSKLVVKPVSKEIAVDGFIAGGGAGREMLANVMADKLQEMLGIELNAPVTKVVSIDGGKIGMEPGKPVACSAQAWSKNTKSVNDLIEEAFAKQNPNAEKSPFGPPQEYVKQIIDTVPKQEIQNKAVFDLIALHCDRHPGNFMIGDDKKLIPIDHGNILPTRAGLVGRKKYLGSSHAVLNQSAAAQEKLSPEMIERLDRLNTNELIDATKSAQLEMKKNTPEADKGDLDEGLKNSKRSIEFLKVAARQLTLAQIYEAYGESQHDIFFTDEEHKGAGFQRAINNRLGGQDTARAELKKTYVNREKDTIDWPAVRKKTSELGWFINLEPADFNSWKNDNADRILRIVTENLKRPQPKLKKVPKPSKAEAKFNGVAVDPTLLQNYLALGGDDSFYQIWPAPQIGDFEQLHRRVQVMENLVGVEDL